MSTPPPAVDDMRSRCVDRGRPTVRGRKVQMDRAAAAVGNLAAVARLVRNRTFLTRGVELASSADVARLVATKARARRLK